MKIKKGDKVRVLAGKDRGKEGNVSRAMPAENKVIVDGVNIAKRHQKPTNATMQGGIIDKAMPVEASNVAVLSPSDGRPTRIGYRYNDAGDKVRICKRTGVDLDG
ncbi:MAG: 50S ribosomal protein L24 [Actinomycetota bacterium]|nr:50S ribosomal protein L24 [Actinomycetota bacterium]MEC8873041.1 50S ribosomal protein L24 [Actinomycetota bacterium]MEC8982144.1 50S ribosomal protein L24 [Actinomycetota bacterium]MED5439054.1 50S ribosomal protein L24 [Actinomycetota bacterium]